MAQEWGVFTDEGLIEGSMWSQEEAQERRRELIAWDEAQGVEDTDEEYEAARICEEHRDAEQRADSCEECHAEADEDEPADEDDEE